MCVYMPSNNYRRCGVKKFLPPVAVVMCKLCASFHEIRPFLLVLLASAVVAHTALDWYYAGGITLMAAHELQPWLRVDAVPTARHIKLYTYISIGGLAVRQGMDTALYKHICTYIGVGTRLAKSFITPAMKISYRHCCWLGRKRWKTFGLGFGFTMLQSRVNELIDVRLVGKQTKLKWNRNWKQGGIKSHQRNKRSSKRPAKRQGQKP